MLTGLEGSQWNVFLVCALIIRLPGIGVWRLCEIWIMFSISSCSMDGPRLWFEFYVASPLKNPRCCLHHAWLCFIKRTLHKVPWIWQNVSLQKAKGNYLAVKKNPNLLTSAASRCFDKCSSLVTSSCTSPTGAEGAFLPPEICPSMPFLHSLSLPILVLTLSYPHSLLPVLVQVSFKGPHLSEFKWPGVMIAESMAAMF